MMYVEVFAPFDDLLERRRNLALMTDIPDMQAYANDWQKLANDFAELGLVQNAAMCESNAKRYGAMAGAYVRTIEQPLAVTAPA